jgi:hypothetical protein
MEREIIYNYIASESSASDAETISRRRLEADEDSPRYEAGEVIQLRDERWGDEAERRSPTTASGRATRCGST